MSVRFGMLIYMHGMNFLAILVTMVLNSIGNLAMIAILVISVRMLVLPMIVLMTIMMMFVILLAIMITLS
jgi:hypothetical protein